MSQAARSGSDVGHKPARGGVAASERPMFSVPQGNARLPRHNAKLAVRARPFGQALDAGRVVNPEVLAQRGADLADGESGVGRPQGCPLQGDRADSIHLSLEIASADETRDTVTIPADIVFLDTAYGWLDDAYPVIAADSDIGADELAALLRRAYFCPSDDSDADSYETQGVQFDDAALHLALKHVASADEATRTAIGQAVWREIHWLMPKARTVDIAVRGNRIDVTVLRVALTRAFGGTDAQGAWLWKDAYDAAEAAVVLFMKRYGAAMRREAGAGPNGPAAMLAMLERLAALEPSHTRRSEEQVRLQQFSTPLPLAYGAVQAAMIRPGDRVLEPSAGTGILAAMAHCALRETASQRLYLNELAPTRAGLLEQLFPGVSVDRRNAETIADYLPGLVPSVVLMNPPFSVSPGVERRRHDADLRHIRSAFSMLPPGGRHRHRPVLRSRRHRARCRRVAGRCSNARAPAPAAGPETRGAPARRTVLPPVAAERRT